MKTPDDLDRLMEDVLTPDHPDKFRGETLEATLAVVRSRKRRRKLVQSAALIALPLALAGGLWLQRHVARPGLHPTRTTSEAAASTPAPTIPGTDIRLISDEELFALFPGRPLALIGPKGNQQLVFLDELRPDSRDAAN
jgi:hypothetical protein